MMSDRPINAARPLKVIYIGAGVSGIVGAIQFRKMLPSVELVIYEKNPEIGGTWYENRYLHRVTHFIMNILLTLFRSSEGIRAVLVVRDLRSVSGPNHH
jgi:protoporphyrinogen oxidase